MKAPSLQIRDTVEEDLPEVFQVHRAAFGDDTEAALVESVLGDPGAQPLISLLAVETQNAVGHALFSHARIAGADDDAALAILAPLAVVPEAQGNGIGSRLVETGMKRLAENGVALLFVLGDPRYYVRFGFIPATPLGLLAPYTLPPDYAEAWMLRHLRDDPRGLRGTIACCDALMLPELWQA